MILQTRATRLSNLGLSLPEMRCAIRSLHADYEQLVSVFEFAEKKLLELKNQNSNDSPNEMAKTNFEPFRAQIRAVHTIKRPSKLIVFCRVTRSSYLVNRVQFGSVYNLLPRCIEVVYQHIIGPQITLALQTQLRMQPHCMKRCPRLTVIGQFENRPYIAKHRSGPPNT